MKLEYVVGVCILIVIAFSLLVAPGVAQAPLATNSSVMNKTFVLWVSQGFADPPFLPFQDCATFTRAQMCLAQCGDCGPLSEVEMGPVSIWRAEVPCGGLNLVFNGTSRNGPEIPVIGATVVGTAEKTNFGAEGVQDQTCSVFASSARGRASYSRP